MTHMEAPRVGELAAAGGIVLHELTPTRGSLETAFMELTRESVEYGGGGAPVPDTVPPPSAVPVEEGETR